MNRFSRYLLLTLFALLQGLAPVAHAHVNGHNADNKIHLEFSESRQFNKTDAVVTQVTSEPVHSSVIGSQPQYKKSDLSPEQHINTIETRADLQCELIVLHLLAETGLARVTFPYQHPCSHAPPL